MYWYSASTPEFVLKGDMHITALLLNPHREASGTRQLRGCGRCSLCLGRCPGPERRELWWLDRVPREQDLTGKWGSLQMSR